MFSDASALITPNPAQLYYGVAVADLDGDGGFEFLVAGFGCPNRLLKWEAGAFKSLSLPVLEDAERQAIGVAAGDVDGDGREEIYVLNTDSFSGRKRHADRLFDYVNAEAGWRDLFSYPENADALNLTAGRSVLALDRQGTGFYSFAVANYGGYFRLYEMEANGFLADLAPYLGLARATGGRSLIAAPFFSNALDLFAGNENDGNFLFRNRGDGKFEEVAEKSGVADPAQHARGVALVDALQNGKLGLVVGNWEGEHRLYRRRGDGTFEETAPAELAEPSPVRTVIAADFDNDGYEEIFFNNIGEPNRLFGWREEGWRPIGMGDALEPFGLGTGAAVADLDGDGCLELLVSHGESGLQPLSLYKPRATGNHWVRIAPKTVYGAPARGAKVTLRTPHREQVRVIDSGSGYLCQMEPVAHFGLGSETRLLEAEITFPGGAKVTLRDLAPDQVHPVPHPA